MQSGDVGDKPAWTEDDSDRLRCLLQWPEMAGQWVMLYPRAGSTPLIVALVLSATDRFTPVMRMVRKHLRAGARLALVIDREDGTVSAHRAGQQPDILLADEELLAEDILAGFRCRIAEYLRSPEQPPEGE